MDVRFFLAAFEGLSDVEVERSVLPFPSHEVDPVSRPRAALRHRLGARPRAARAHRRAPRGWSSPPPRRCCRGCRPAARLRTAALTVSTGPRDLPHRPERAARGRRLHPPGSGRRVRRVLRPRRRGRFLPGGRRAADPARVRRRHDRVDPHLRPATQRSTGAIDQAAIVPLHRAARRSGRRRSVRPRFFDYLSAAAGRRSSCPSRTRSTRTAPGRTNRCSRGYDDALARGPAGAVPGDAGRSSGPPSQARLDARRPPLETLALGRTDAAAHIAVTAGASSSAAGSQDWVAEIKRGRERGDTMVFVAHTQGRAERTIELLADYDLRGADRARRGCAHGIGAGRRRPAVARVPAARRQPAAVGRDRRLRGRAAGARAPALRDPHLPVRLPRSQGRRPRRPRRPRHRRVRRAQADRRSGSSRRSSWSCATPARTSCSSRSSGSISSRSTPARRGRRSTGWAARPGRRPRRASRRRCATWRRSC